MTDSTLPTPAAIAAPARATARSVSAWQLGWRQLGRDFRAGELRLLVVAVTLAVAALTAVGFFADRINGGLARDARQMLGGDAIVSSDQPAPAEFLARAGALGLTTATMANFPSMGRAPDEKGGATRLVSAKAVSDAYPLRGRLRVRDAAGSKEVDVAAAPARGTVWVDVAVLDSLGLAVGDALLLGDSSLRIARVIVIEPDRGAGFASLAPRVMLNHADLAATGLVQPASRISYRLAVAANAGSSDAKVAEFVDWAETRSRRKPCAGSASSRWPPAGPRCARRSTAPRNSSTSSPCCRRCSPRSRSASPRAISPAAISTTARCCASSACRSERSRCNT
jgi:putative ABC transport system permease protein